jgi:predicted DNA-binding transcriptional regulator AlpA
MQVGWFTRDNAMPHTPQSPHNDPMQDVLRGAPAVAAFLGMSPSAVYSLISRGHLPHTRLGKTIVCSKTKLLKTLGIDA